MMLQRQTVQLLRNMILLVLLLLFLLVLLLLFLLLLLLLLLLWAVSDQRLMHLHTSWFERHRHCCLQLSHRLLLLQLQQMRYTWRTCPGGCRRRRHRRGRRPLRFMC